MTQLMLADMMNVSFQAVSNWERGMSMPDIAKLPELAALFGVTIDRLLGQSAPLVQSAAEGRLTEYMHHGPVTEAELADVAPLLTPAQADDAVEQAANFDHINWNHLAALMPFVSTRKVDELIARFGETMPPDLMLQFAPFASHGALDHLADRLLCRDQPDTLPWLLPFLSQAKVDELLLACCKDLPEEHLANFAPFASRQTVDRMLEELLSRHSQRTGHA